MIATVHYPHNTQFEIVIPGGQDTFLDLVLNYIWEETQADMSEIRGKPSQLEEFRNQGKRFRSSMVGDVYAFRDRCYVVNLTGFVELKPEALLAYLEVPQEDQVMGWKWVIEHSPNPRIFLGATLIP